MNVASSCTRSPRPASAATVGAILETGLEMSKSTRTTLGWSRALTRASYATAWPALIPTVKPVGDGRGLGAGGVAVFSASPAHPARASKHRNDSARRAFPHLVE